MLSYKTPETEIDFANCKNMFEKNSSKLISQKRKFYSRFLHIWWEEEYILLWKFVFFFSFFFVFPFPVYENVRVSLIKRRTAVPIDGLVGIEVACDILNK